MNHNPVVQGPKANEMGMAIAADVGPTPEAFRFQHQAFAVQGPCMGACLPGVVR